MKRLQLLALACLASLWAMAQAVEVYTVNGVQFRMVQVKGGTFQMGATAEQKAVANKDEKPVHQVTLSDFSIGETEVTQELWTAVMGSNPSLFEGSQRPVENVTWADCQRFICELNAITGQLFRLPTEAEWEFAARGGQHSGLNRYAGSNMLTDVAWCSQNAGSQTHDVKKRNPNELGLYDMSGNVWEWCQDWFCKYKSQPQEDPVGIAKDGYRVARGGSWYDADWSCRVSRRTNCPPAVGYSHLGLRLAL